MNKEQLEKVVNMLQTHLEESEIMWKGGMSYPHIIGYLQGTIKGTVTELENFTK
jgi:hypothetical protein